MNKAEENGVGFTRHKAFVELLAESEKEILNGAGRAMDDHAPLAAGELDKSIEILDAQGTVRAEIETDRPDWSFVQYCRNRETSGWSWRFRKRSGEG